MKKINLVIIVIMLALVSLGWYGVMDTSLKEDQAYRNYLSTAQSYQKEGLYQKAISCYDSALAIREEKSTREKWIECYILGYEDGVFTPKAYFAAMETMCGLDSKNIQRWEMLLEGYLAQNDYDEIRAACAKIRKANVSSPRILEIQDAVDYSYRIRAGSYVQFRRGNDGRFAVRNTKGWGVVAANGDRLNNCEYTYISPFAANGNAVYAMDDNVRIYNTSMVVEAILQESFIDSGIYNSGVLPVCLEEGTWRFLSAKSNKFVFDTYEMASNFVNGIAAVKTTKGWTLIDHTGAQACKTVFDDVKLLSNGDYVSGGIMVASVKGTYGFYDAKGNPLNDFCCKDADIYMGGYIAYQDNNGLWGYVDTTGKTVLKPQFEQAKSFSNGLAAVCVDGLWGFAKENGTIVIACEFLDADYFNKEGFCFVSPGEGVFQGIQLRY